MKFSENWLREWANPQVDRETLVAQVTMAGLEVDGVEAAAGSFSGVLVGEVVSVEQHPDADKLSVCQVNNGLETLQVVCGAKNVRPGIKVPFAQVGAILPGDFKIKAAELRGVASQGMLCAESELGLADQSDGLFELPSEAPVGQDINIYMELDDVIVEVDLTPNRSDCFSIRGIAREVSVINRCAYVEPEIEEVPASIEDTFEVVLEDSKACPRYLGRVIKGINSQAESPLWMRERLRRCGLRSIDPVVDVTNYVMLELGQPMHAFDLDRLEERVIVRPAQAGEKLTLLDGQTLELRADTLVIADANKALALAGIMGGEHSGIQTDTTNNLFLEVAFFNPLAIVGKARSYGLHTDSSHRFERGVDHGLQKQAMDRATQLLIDIVGGEPGPVVDTHLAEELPSFSSVNLRQEKLNALLGLDIPSEEIEDILVRLGFDLESKSDSSWTFGVPSHRFDVSIEPDLIEEVGRVYGYNNLPKTISQGGLELKADPEAVSSVDQVKDCLIGLGYQEAITYSFIEPELANAFVPESETIALANPISADMSIMRPSLLPGLLKSVAYNQNRQQSRVRFFETGLQFVKRADEIVQTRMLSGVAVGTATQASWASQPRPLDFYDLKGDLESLFSALKSEALFSKGEHVAMHPGQCAEIRLGDQRLGFMGAVHPKLQKTLDLNGPLFVFELFLDELVMGQVPHFEAVSKYPEVRRDLAIVIDQSVEFSEIQTIVQESAGDYLASVNPFDVYVGAHLGASQKSIAMALIWRRQDRTFSDDEINASFDNIVQALEQRVDARLRS